MHTMNPVSMRAAVIAILAYPYKGPSLPMAETMITLLAVSSQTYSQTCKEKNGVCEV